MLAWNWSEEYQRFEKQTTVQPIAMCQATFWKSPDMELKSTGVNGACDLTKPDNTEQKQAMGKRQRDFQQGSLSHNTV